jgi:serine/threonine-protein kinase
LLLVALIALFAVMSLNGIFGSKTPNVTVPNLVGKTLDQAKAQYGSTIDIIQGTTTYSDKYAEGLICDQDQAAGTSVKKNSPVTVKISSGSKTVQIPSDIVNESQADAQTELTNLGFTNVKIASISSPDVAKGFVIKTDPAVGQKISTSTQITVYISTGPDQTALIAVPDLTGKTYAQAKAALEQAGLALGSVSPADTTVTSTGLVQSQNPTATTKVTRGSGVNITLALPVADSVDIDFTVPVKNTDNGYTITVSFDNKGIDSLSESQIYGPSTITITKGLSSGTKTIRIYAQAKDDTQPSQIKTVSFNFDTMTIVSQSDSQYNASPASSSPSSSSSSTSGH